MTNTPGFDFDLEPVVRSQRLRSRDHNLSCHVLATALRSLGYPARVVCRSAQYMQMDGYSENVDFTKEHPQIALECKGSLFFLDGPGGWVEQLERFHFSMRDEDALGGMVRYLGPERKASYSHRGALAGYAKLIKESTRQLAQDEECRPRRALAANKIEITEEPVDRIYLPAHPQLEEALRLFLASDARKIQVEDLARVICKGLNEVGLDARVVQRPVQFHSETHQGLMHQLCVEYGTPRRLAILASNTEGPNTSIFMRFGQDQHPTWRHGSTSVAPMSWTFPEITPAAKPWPEFLRAMDACLLDISCQPVTASLRRRL